MPTRRETVRFVGSMAILTGLSGCRTLSGGSVSVEIENRTAEQQSVSVSFDDNGETIFADQYTVPSNGEITKSDVVNAGEYQVLVELNSENSATVDFSMQSCDSNSLFIAILEEGDVEAEIAYEC